MNFYNIIIPAWNNNLAVIFEAKLKAAIDNQKPRKSLISKRCFHPRNSAV